MKGILRFNHFRVVSLWNCGGLEGWRTSHRKRLLKNGSSHPPKRLKTNSKHEDEGRVGLQDSDAITENFENGLDEHATDKNESRIEAKVEQVSKYNPVVAEVSEGYPVETELPPEEETEKYISENIEVQEYDAGKTEAEEKKAEGTEAEITQKGSAHSESLPLDSSVTCYNSQMQAYGACPAQTASQRHFDHPADNSEIFLTADGLDEARNQCHKSAPPQASYVQRKDGGAVVYLFWGDFVVFDGCARVAVLQGRAKMLGYSLGEGAEVTVSSNFKLSSALTIEPYKLGDRAIEQEPLIAQDLGLSYNSNDTAIDAELDKLACVLQFRSVNVEQASTLPDCTNGLPKSETVTFQVDVMAGRKKDWATFREQVNIQVCDENRLPDVQLDEAEVSADVSTPIRRNRQTGDCLDCSAIKSSAPSHDFRSQPTQIPSSWRAAAHTITSKPSQSKGISKLEVAPIVVICGAKGTGKSTFSRFLVNELLNIHSSVGYLDTDVGQPEFTIPGCLSLHVLQEPILGSPVLHLWTPKKFYFYGDISPKGDPTHYISCIQDLYSFFLLECRKSKEQEEEVPLVINTHGWLKGIGMEVLLSILRTSKPTHLVRIVSSVTQKNIPPGRFWQTIEEGSIATKILSVDSYTRSPNISQPPSDVPSRHSGKNASELRALRILAYFQKCHGGRSLLFPIRETDLFSETAKALACQIPYEVPMLDLKILHLHSEVPENQSLHSINAELVGLATASPSQMIINETVLRPECLGFGIVRGIDVRRNLLYLITPLPLEKLQFVDIILHGRVKIPVQLLQAEGYPCPYLCRNSVVIEGTGSAVMRNHKRISELQMKGSL